MTNASLNSASTNWACLDMVCDIWFQILGTFFHTRHFCFRVFNLLAPLNRSIHCLLHIGYIKKRRTLVYEQCIHEIEQSSFVCFCFLHFINDMLFNSQKNGNSCIDSVSLWTGSDAVSVFLSQDDHYDIMLFVFVRSKIFHSQSHSSTGSG